MSGAAPVAGVRATAMVTFVLLAGCVRLPAASEHPSPTLADLGLPASLSARQLAVPSEQAYHHSALHEFSDAASWSAFWQRHSNTTPPPFNPANQSILAFETTLHGNRGWRLASVTAEGDHLVAHVVSDPSPCGGSFNDPVRDAHAWIVDRPTAVRANAAPRMQRWSLLSPCRDGDGADVADTTLVPWPWPNRLHVDANADLTEVGGHLAAQCVVLDHVAIPESVNLTLDWDAATAPQLRAQLGGSAVATGAPPLALVDAEPVWRASNATLHVAGVPQLPATAYTFTSVRVHVTGELVYEGFGPPPLGLGQEPAALRVVAC